MTKNKAAKPVYPNPGNAVDKLFRDKDSASLWREDSSALVSRLQDCFHETFDSLSDQGIAPQALQKQVARCSALIKMHWALNVQTGRGSMKRQETADRLLHLLAEIETACHFSVISPYVFECTPEESAAMEELIAELPADRPVAGMVKEAPLLGILTQVPQQGGQFRSASVLGVVDQLTETSEQEITDRFLCAHRHFLKRLLA